MSKALHVLEYGTEQVSENPTKWERAIAHFDIKLANSKFNCLCIHAKLC